MPTKDTGEPPPNNANVQNCLHHPSTKHDPIAATHETENTKTNAKPAAATDNPSVRPIINPYRSPSQSATLSRGSTTPAARTGRGSTFRPQQVSILHPLQQRSSSQSPHPHITPTNNPTLTPMDCDSRSIPDTSNTASQETTRTPSSTPNIQHQSSSHKPTGNDGFTEVRSKKSTTIICPLDEKSNRFGILLSRIAPKQALQNQGVDVGAIFNAILQLDPDATFLPHNNDTQRAAKLSTMLKPTNDFKTMMDFEITNWGKPSENHGKLSISFYLASDVLKADLLALRQHHPLQHILKQHKLNMSSHNLLQSDSRAVAFFSGKSVAHTWRTDLRERFNTYLTEQLQDANTMHNLFGEDHEVPAQLPFHFRVTTIRSKRTQTQAIAIYVGTLHKEFLETIITRSPFQDVEVVPLSLQRKDLTRFEKHVHLHEFICNNSTGIKLIGTTNEFRDTFRLAT